MAFVGRTDVKDPGAEQQQWDRLAQRRERLYAADEQFRDTRPDDAVAEAARRPGVRIAEVMATVMEGYAIRRRRIEAGLTGICPQDAYGKVLYVGKSGGDGGLDP